MVMSSGARRLRAIGLDSASRAEVKHWFLKGSNDVRSSNYLEIAATEFEIQGLELDWTCLAWGADLLPNVSGKGQLDLWWKAKPDVTSWTHRAFKGSKWQKVMKEDRKRYITNKYRVLLTRAREGMIICVPRGRKEDPTFQPEWYDSVYEYLLSCGVTRAT